MKPRWQVVLMCLLLCADTVMAAAPAAKMIAVNILDRHSRQPLAGLLVEIKSVIPVQCLRAPCPPGEQQHWQGTTDASGVLRFPASLDEAGAIVYLYAVGSGYAANLHDGGKRVAGGRPSLLLEKPPAK
jgi:ABC-type Co2+ transport system permease subunit